MKNTLFTGIAGENLSGIAHHLGRGVQYRSSARSRAGPWYRDTSFEQRRWREISLLQLRRPLLPLQVYYFK